MTMYLSCKASGCHRDMVQIKQRIQHKLKKIFNIGGSTAMQSEETERLREVFTGVQGTGPLAGVARGKRPLAEGNFVFCKLYMHNFRTLNLQKYINPPFHKRTSIWGNPKCKIHVPFLSKIIRVQDFGDCKGVKPPCLRKFCIWWVKYA